MQGIGAGGVLALTEIILSDLVPLRERGAYQGMIGLIWSIASIIGPIVVRPFHVTILYYMFNTSLIVGRSVRTETRLDMERSFL